MLPGAAPCGTFTWSVWPVFGSVNCTGVPGAAFGGTWSVMNAAAGAAMVYNAGLLASTRLVGEKPRRAVNELCTNFKFYAPQPDDGPH